MAYAKRTYADRVPCLDHLPVIVKKAGLYRLRNGDLAKITLIDKKQPLFKAVGIRMRNVEGQAVVGNEAWHVSGRYISYDETAIDIVAKVEP